MIGLYLHVPYCSIRCSYCDFYLVPGRHRDLSAFASALGKEIEEAGREHPGLSADTVHFGGGTPSLLSPGLLAGLLESLRASFRLAPEAEIALEANPEDLDADRLAGYAAAGLNRLTIGVQSLDDRLLRLMRRPHDARRALAAVALAKRSPVRSVGVDLILGLPDQDARTTLEGIARLTDLEVDHVSLYLLEVHASTSLGRDLARGRRLPMEDDAAARLFDEASRLLEERGFDHYEISNFSRPGHRSRHNLKYWTDQAYLGFGPSAHSYVGERRWANASDLRDYLARRGAGCARIEDVRSRARRSVEALVAGLRLAEGVDLRVLAARYGASFAPPDDATIGGLAEAGFLLAGDGRLRLTERGRLVSNEILERLLPPNLQLM
ncbi:MAG TPA: radical SAM family heme chaperone HemW [Candidatus Polarisedimenticolia bacterium]|nr:radical SAM family heme chaperone HemW [Candidatus Polarisedimenticolia bacterium]